MPKFFTISPEEISRARALYEGTDMPVEDIAKMLGMGATTLYRKIKEWRWTPRSARMQDYDKAAKSEADAVREVSRAPSAIAEKESVIDRVRGAVEREIVAIEAVLSRVEGARLRSGDAERAARTLATLVKTLREVAALERDEKPETDSIDNADDEFRDLEEFRAELAERLDRVRRARDAE